MDPDNDPRFPMDSDFTSVHNDPGQPFDTDAAVHHDPGTPLDSEIFPHVEPGSIMDTEPVAQTSTPPEARMSRCINCGADVTERRRHSINLVEVQSVVGQWIAPQIVQDTSTICHSCWSLALHESNVQEEPTASSDHHRHLCVNCGTSILRTRSHMLRTDTERETRIRNTIMEWIRPRQLRPADKICHPCWQRSDRAGARPSETSHTSRSGQPTINLPNLTRAPDTHGHCFFPECGSTERLTVPNWLRVKLFIDLKFYVPETCRICSFHLHNDNWQQLETIQQPIHSFTANHIEDFATFVNERVHLLDFSRIETMADETVYYWIGLSKEQFTQLYSDVPRLHNRKNGKVALAALLLKLRTGDSDERISKFLDIPRTTLMRLITDARKILNEDFVPRNLGINHITRAEIALRNLLIPNGLFGGDGRPIVIMDGTYLYVQKSSNYMYQKDTYSLHKYRNLMKPFVIVCTDGYIIDVLGPYPATTSDAQIIQNEFNDESKPLRQYFQSGDVFILDRGFRDCVPLLEQLNYSVHTPACREEGESQLSTLAANQSRTVTICRWVVEAVNGIFKQSYRLLRHEFFNKASLHAMTDFRIAAALTNKFHQRISDREDAGTILQIINMKLNTNNDLADYVNGNNLNRRRTQFLNINVNTDSISFPRLQYTDLILIACGTYQLKQARSYYGEHIRSDGSYTIEVCRNTASNLLEGFPSAENDKLLRAKIHSRHISRKIYFVYILYENNGEGREAVKHYCCNCIVGRRTVGCCAHIMTVIWYLSWARYEDNINPPAQFLDAVLITYDSD